MAAIELRGLTKRYPDGYEAVRDVDLTIADGEFVSLVGPSGSGKSTMLQMLGGLEDITAGELLIDGQRANDAAPRERNLAMAFQKYLLYPHLSVAENIAFPLRLARLADAQVRSRVAEVARLLELTAHLDRKPSQLSGGQRQRVAMGRAIVRRPNAFLFDEPLSTLDAKLRVQMRTEIGRLQRRLAITTLYVTHDQTEAMTLADRVAVLCRGMVQQVDPPLALYQRPVNLFVAVFIGSPGMNLLPASVHDGPSGRHLRLPMVDVPLTPAMLTALGGRTRVLAGIRPEHFQHVDLVGDARPAGATFRAPVDVIEWMGAELFVHLPYRDPGGFSRELAGLGRDLAAATTPTSALVARLDPASPVRERRVADLWMDTRHLHLFDPETGLNLTR